VSMSVGTASAHAATVTIQNGQCSPVPSGTGYCFNPPSQTASPGEQVTWANSSSAPHTVTRCDPANCNGVGGGTGPDGWSGSSTINAGGGTYHNVFTGPGTYVYYCTIHGYAAMHGTITVLAPDTAPTAGFGITPGSPTVGQAVIFDGSASNDSDGDTITSYRWDFGDGATQATSTPTTTHAYSAAGSFTAKLMVVDARGSSSAPVSRTVTVTGAAADTPPTARFSITPASPTVGQAVIFDGSASSDPDGDVITSYRWDFGDGRTSTTTSATVTHSYRRAGAVKVKLVVVDSHAKQSAAATKTVAVSRPPPRLATKLRLGTSRLCANKTRACRHTSTRLTFSLSRADAVSVVIKRGGKLIRRKTLKGRAGSNSLPFSAAGLRPGRYLLILTPLGGKALRTTFTVI
jgi:PKD repeat protein